MPLNIKHICRSLEYFPDKITFSKFLIASLIFNLSTRDNPQCISSDRYNKNCKKGNVKDMSDMYFKI